MNFAWEHLVTNVADFNMKEGVTSFINPYSMYLLKDKSNLVSRVDYWHIDGISLVHIINLIKRKKVSRYSFDETSIAPKIFKFAKEKKYKIAIIGTKPELINKAIHNIEKKYEIKIDYYRNGYFLNDDEVNGTIEKILNHNVKIVICGMGTPLQEAFLLKLKSKNWEGYGYTCGGYLHQTSQNISYYPSFFDKYNIRWAYRIYTEPKLLLRYFYLYPKFFILFFSFILKNTSILFVRKHFNR